MADAGQRIVFREDRDGGAAGLAELGRIGRLQPERAALNGNVMPCDRVFQLRGRLEFLQREFRLLVNRMRKFQQFRAHAVDRGRDIFLQGIQ
jgi:hypothetical protein